MTASEQPLKPPLPDLKDIVVAGPYCGVYSLYACLGALDKRPPMEELLTTEFVGSLSGSTAEELIAAAEKQGIYAKCYGNMTWRQLFEAAEPMVLHFRGSGDRDFNHWVAFLGAEGKHVRIIDIPHELVFFSIAELLAHWDGTAVVLSKNPIREDMIWRKRFDYLSIAMCLLGGVFLIKTFMRSDKIEHSGTPTRSLLIKKLCVQTISFFGIVGFVAILFHSVTDIGFLKNPAAVAEVTHRYYTVDVPEISLREMKRIAESKNTFIFDTRYRNDFQHGAIPNATNLPIDSSLGERKTILNGIDKSAKIILYCQSSRCGFADEIASFLKFNNYRNVFIFRGGYSEWSIDSSHP